jgi:phage I-like protein
MKLFSPLSWFNPHIVAILASVSEQVTVCAGVAVEVASAEGEPKEWVQLMPMGTFGTTRDSRGPWRIADQAHAERVIAASQRIAGGVDIPVDYDHALEAALDPKLRTPAPASGWIKALQARPDGLYGRIEWTSAAAAKLKAREYRYISPVFTHETAKGGAPGDVVSLLRAGLTNYPALTDQLAIAASGQGQSGADMDLKALAAALGLSADATLDQIVAAAAALKAAHGQVAVAAGLTAAAQPGEVVTAVAGLKTQAGVDPTKFVPRETYDALSARVAKIETDTVEEKAVAAVDTAIASGKIAPATRDWYLSHARRDLADFERFVGAAPVVVAAGRLAQTAKAPAEVSVNDEEMAVAAAMGLSKDEYLNSKKGVAR